VALDRVAALHRELGELERAAKAGHESLALSRQLRTTLGDTPQVLRDLSIALDNVGDVHRDLGELDRAAEAYRESLALRRQRLAALGETPTTLVDLARSLTLVGSTERARSNSLPAREALVEAAELSRKRLALVDSQPAKLDLAYDLLAIAELDLDEGRHGEARPLLEECSALLTEIDTSANPAVLQDVMARLAVARAGSSSADTQ
jgi:tetratricopeptide (TPR) repeat protein